MGIRVAHIIGSLNVGGAERNLVNLLNAMSVDYRAAIMLEEHSGEPAFSGGLDESIEQHYVSVRRRNFPFGIARLASLLREKNVNVVHTHMFHASLYGVLAAKLANIPVIFTTEHGENPWKKSVHRWAERIIITPLVDMRLCVSPRILALRKDEEGIPKSKLKLIFNGTVIPSLEVRRERSLVPVIGAVGRFIPAKDYPLLIEAAASLKDSGYKFKLQILGDGPERANVSECISKLGVEDIVDLPGMVSDVSRWYREFDIYVSSSLREGQPVALLEAMAHRLPVVATNCGSIASTVGDQEGGLIVPPGDDRALASALAKLIDDAQLREKFGENARGRAEREFSVTAVAAEHTRLYEEILATKGLGGITESK